MYSAEDLDIFFVLNHKMLQLLPFQTAYQLHFFPFIYVFIARPFIISFSSQTFQKELFIKIQWHGLALKSNI